MTDPSGDPQLFDFTLTGGPSNLNESFQLADATPPFDSGAILPGSGYVATETVPAGWDLVSATCDDGSPVTNIDVGPGETVTCTFTDVRRGRIIIDKETVPSGDPQLFDFTLTGGPSNLNQSFQLADATPPHDSGPVLPGSGYNAAETVPAGWDLVSATCDDGSSVDNIDVASGETVTCTFRDVKRGHILIDKVTDPSGDPQLFDFTLTGGPSNLNLSFQLADATPPFDSGPVLPGSGYAAAETVPAGWDLVSATCDDGSPVTNIDVSPGETVTCTFNDRARARINIHKQDDAGNALEGAVFTLFVDNDPFDGPPPHGAEDTATTLTCTTGADGNCSITDIVPGQYWVVETTGVPGHDTAPDQNVIISAGTTLPLIFVDPRQHVVIVLVCHQGTNTLAASDVVNGTESGTSLSTPPEGITEAQLCALGGARFEGKQHGLKNLTVDVGSDAHP